MTPEEEKVHFDTFGSLSGEDSLGQRRCKTSHTGLTKDAMSSVVLSQVKGKWLSRTQHT